MNTSQELAPYVAQFVPIKLDTATEDFRNWNREHPSEGGGIPKVYIVRADGETLYAKTGSLNVPQLGQLLATSLANGGRILSEREAATLIEINDEMTELRADGKVQEAIKTLRKLRKFGKPGEFVSYAAPVLAIEEQVKEMTEKGTESLERVTKSLESAGDEEKKKLAALNDYQGIRDQYYDLPTLKEPFSKITRKINRDKELRSLMKGIRALDRAAQATTERAKASAVVKLEALLKDYPSGELHDRINKQIERLKK